MLHTYYMHILQALAKMIQCLFLDFIKMIVYELLDRLFVYPSTNYQIKVPLKVTNEIINGHHIDLK